MLRAFLLCLVFGGSAQAQNRMDAATFDEHVTGRTVTYLYVHNGSTGIERYMSGRRVMWSSTAGICQYGVWYESKGDICFRYDHDPEPKCWSVYDEPGGMRGDYTTRAPFAVIREMEGRDDPLICNDLSS